MASTDTLLPPTSVTMAARSCVEVTTFTAANAVAGPSMANSAAMVTPSGLVILMIPCLSSICVSRTARGECPEPLKCLERMCPVRAYREQKLEQQFVRRHVFGVPCAPVLPAYLAEFARPVRQHD